MAPGALRFGDHWGTTGAHASLGLQPVGRPLLSSRFISPQKMNGAAWRRVQYPSPQRGGPNGRPDEAL
jgi:hypothetical protein